MKQKLTQALDEHKIQLSDNQIANLCDFVSMMKEYNKIHNITSITNDEDIVYKHLLDSLLPLYELQKIYENNNKNTQKYIKMLDIGCGGGFPSIPLSIATNELNITALDSVHKKTAFVEMVKNNLKITNLNVVTSRIEDIASKPEFREQFDIVTSRAVAPLNIILEYSAPMLKNGGYIFTYKGSNYKEELDNTRNALKILDCTIETIYEYNIPEINAKRYVLKIRKNSKISTKYPRKQNKPRLQPL